MGKVRLKVPKAKWDVMGLTLAGAGWRNNEGEQSGQVKKGLK